MIGMSKPSRALADFDPFAPDVVQEPYEFFAALRREAPLYRLTNGAYYLMSRYRDVRSAAMNIDTYSSNLIAVLMQGQEGIDRPELLSLSGDGAIGAVDALAVADPPVHTRQRKISNKAFSMRRVAALEPAIRVLAESLVGAILPQGGARWSSADWMRDVAVPLPMTVIAGLIGLPSEDIPQLKHWSDAAVSVLSGVNTPARFVEIAGQVSQLIAYFAQRVDDAARAPKDDVLGDLVRSQASGELTRDEVIAILGQILTAGNESTTSLIGSALLLLLENPSVERRIRADRALLEPFIEEALRLESPFHGHFRLVRRDTEVAGEPLPAGSRVMLLWSAANRDGDEFPNPDTIDLARRNAKAHLAFGIGIHHCIGAALARLETRVALETLFARTSALRRADGKVAHVHSMLVRCLTELSVEIGGA
jgi:cytochrome P450